MAAQVIGIVRRWLDDPSSLSRTKAAAQLVRVLSQSPNLVALTLRLEGGPSALVVGLHNLDATSGPLQASRTILHAIADTICVTDTGGSHAATLRAAKPAIMISKHIMRLRPLSEPDPERLQRMDAAQREKTVMRAVHISEMAMLLHCLVLRPYDLEVRPSSKIAVKWHSCMHSYG